jgi:hypothetical protein
MFYFSELVGLLLNISVIICCFMLQYFIRNFKCRCESVCAVFLETSFCALFSVILFKGLPDRHSLLEKVCLHVPTSIAVILYV